MSISELFQSEGRADARQTRSRLPRFHTTAGDQLDLLRTDRFANLRVKIRNAFTPSQPVADHRLFAGRRGVLEQMIRGIEDQRLHLVAYGERGIGKTSLLHTLADAAREARYIVVYRSCGATSNFDETFRAVAADIPLFFHSQFSPTKLETTAGTTLADLLPNGRLTPPVFGDLVAKLIGTRVLIILDEFDRCESADFRREVAELIKITSDRSVRVGIVIAGVGADLAELVEHIPSIRRNILAFQVPLMEEDEIRELIEIGQTSSNVVFEAATRDLVVAIAQGSPYIASLICHHSALSAVDAQRTSVRASDLAVGLDQATQEQRDRLSRPVQARIDRMVKRGGARLLSVLAGASLHSGGEFDETAIANAAGSSAECTQAKRLAEEMAAAGDLLIAQSETGPKRYAFGEEGIPHYLWLLGMQAVIAEPEMTEKAEGRATAI